MSFREGHYFSPEQARLMQDQPEQVVNFSAISEQEMSAVWQETFKSGMHGICFSLYEDGQKPGDIITEQQVDRRIQIIKPHVKWVRSFSCIEGNEHIARIAHQNGLKTLVGAWLGSDLELNEQEINGLIALAKEGCVSVAAVGNEVMYRGDLTEDQLLAYIHRVKEALPNIPVGYVDAYYEFSHRPRITEACDVILTNCYPYWEGCPIEYALPHMQSMFASAKGAGNGKPVIITETGWPSQGGALKGAVASYENALRYFIETQQWSQQNNIDIFYFSSFDESWKVGAEGEVGAYWGIWDKDENLKFEI
ncbi:MAG: glycosyl hydrolase [Flavobacterium sp. BFFFF2]|nr:MAG: glycosyl hydrolase [Flavobacterium sp. BFFFF2]